MEKRKRHSVVHLKDLVKKVANQNKITSKSVVNSLIESLGREFEDALLNDKIVDINGNRFVISKRKLNPSCGASETYKISSTISRDLKEKYKRKFEEISESFES